MSPYRKNILVGTTVLGGLLVVGWMMLQFSSRLVGAFTAPQITIHFESTRADGLSDGSSVQYLGVTCGRVASVRRKSDGSGVLIDATVDRTPPLPANVRAAISSTNALGGTATLNLDIDGEKAHGELQEGATLKAEYVGLQLNLLPPAMQDTAAKIGAMSEEIAKTAKQLRESNAITDLDTTIHQIQDTAAKAGVVMESLNKAVGNPETAQDINTAITNIRDASENASKIARKIDTLADKLGKNSDDVSETLKSTRGHIDDLSKALGDRLVQISGVLTNVQEITDKIANGKGSAGQMLNDPRLYQALVDSSRELSATVTDLHRLIDQWEQEGVTLKVK